MSGSHIMIGDRRTALYGAAELATRSPGLAFRNPEILRRSLALQREQRAHFIDLFGSDLAVGTPPEIDAAYRRFLHTWQKNAISKAELDESEARRPAKPLNPALPEELRSARSVGLIFDAAEGVIMIRDLGHALDHVDSEQQDPSGDWLLRDSTPIAISSASISSCWTSMVRC